MILGTCSICHTPRDSEGHTCVEAAALTEQIAELLAEHAGWHPAPGNSGYIECTCGSIMPVGLKMPHVALQAHQAAVLAARLADIRPVVTETSVTECEVHEVELVHRCVNCGDIIQVGSGV